MQLPLSITAYIAYGHTVAIGGSPEKVLHIIFGAALGLVLSLEMSTPWDTVGGFNPSKVQKMIAAY